MRTALRFILTLVIATVTLSAASQGTITRQKKPAQASRITPRAKRVPKSTASPRKPSPTATLTADELFERGYDAYTDDNYREAAKWFRQAAEKGHSDAQFYLGHCYFQGNGVELDYTEGRKWMLRAAEQNDPYAQDMMGWVYDKGVGVEPNMDIAVNWYRRAAAQGLAESIERLREIEGDASGGAAYKSVNTAQSADPTEEKYQKGLDYYYREAYTEAAVLMRDAAQDGHAQAQTMLGFFYDRGYGVGQDYKAAAKWYRMAANQGSAVSQYNLGVIYDRGLGVEPNYSEALRWYRMAANQGDSDAYNGLGYIYFFGKGVPENYSEAAKMFRNSAELDNIDGQYNLGYCYENGLGLAKDRNQAIYWYRKAAEQGHEQAADRLNSL